MIYSHYYAIVPLNKKILNPNKKKVEYGEGEYKFMLTAIDGDLNGGGGVDKFRIKIWYEEFDEFENEIEHIVYDNGEDPENGEEEVLTELGGGQIVIHKSK